MSFNYSLDADQRFNQNFSEKYVDLLSTHGFPLVDEQEKNVHKLGKSLGAEVDELQFKVREIFQQTKIQTAEGDQIDSFMNQFNIFRGFGESDEQFKNRSLSLLFPKKVTRPFILETLRQILSDDENLPQVISPWRSVIDYDSTKEISTYDLGNGYMWSPDYWRSGIVVFRTELNETVNSYVSNLIALGIHPVFEQFSYSSTEIEVGKTDYGFQSNYSIEDFNNSYYDVSSTDFDDILHNYDTNDFANNPYYREQAQFTTESFAFEELLNRQIFYNYQSNNINFTYDYDLFKLIETFYNSETIRFAESFSLNFNGLDFIDEILSILEMVSTDVSYNTTLGDEPVVGDRVILGYPDGSIADLFLDQKTKCLSAYSIRNLLTSNSSNPCITVNGNPVGFSNNILNYSELFEIDTGHVNQIFDQLSGSLDLNAMNSGGLIVSGGEISGDDTLTPFINLTNDSYVLPSSNWLNNNSVTFIFSLEIEDIENAQLLRVPSFLEFKTTDDGRVQVLVGDELLTTQDDKITSNNFNTIAFKLDFSSKTVSIFTNGTRIIRTNSDNLSTIAGNVTFELFNSFSGGFYDLMVFKNCSDLYVESLMVDIHLFWNRSVPLSLPDDDLFYLTDYDGSLLTDYDGNFLIEEYPNAILTEDGNLLLTEDFEVILYD